ncbi:hypothetical protein PMAYCL1PPCAC_04715 [Pristionchus mayeri]|uniref:Uncharacterized protein n=1 Tax=Pristionchus mayeri TaxID=1317129 RepID=A0AAN5C8E2_9BILA|nr:hypothetical protein PMAYCL1PPCAC_04715 [Pristionchus mayeri]
MGTLRDVDSTQDAELRIAYDCANDVYQKLKHTQCRPTMENKLLRDLAAIALEAIDCIELDTVTLSPAAFDRVFVYATSDAKSPLIKLGYSLTVLLERLLTDRFASDASSDLGSSPQPSTSYATAGAFEAGESSFDDVVKVEPADEIEAPIECGREIKEEPIEEPIADTFCPASEDPIASSLIKAAELQKRNSRTYEASKNIVGSDATDITLGEFLKNKESSLPRIKHKESSSRTIRRETPSQSVQAMLVPSLQPVDTKPLFNNANVGASPVEVKEEPLSDFEEAPDAEPLSPPPLDTIMESINGVVHVSSVRIKEAPRTAPGRRSLWNRRGGYGVGPSNSRSMFDDDSVIDDDMMEIKEEPSDKPVGSAKRKRKDPSQVDPTSSGTVNTEIINVRALDLKGLTSSTSEGCIDDDSVMMNQLLALKNLAKPVNQSRTCHMCGDFTDKFEGTPPAPEKRDAFLRRIIALTERDKAFVAALRKNGNHAWLCKKHIAHMQLAVNPAAMAKKTRWCDFCTDPEFPCRHSPTDPASARLFFEHVIDPNPIYAKKIEWFLTRANTRATICRKHIREEYKAKLDADDEKQRKKAVAKVNQSLACDQRLRLLDKSLRSTDKEVNVSAKYKLRVVDGIIQFDESQDPKEYRWRRPTRNPGQTRDPGQAGPSGAPTP